jgi:kynurenine formamidase
MSQEAENRTGGRTGDRIGDFPVAASDLRDATGRLESRLSGRIIDLTLTLRDGMRGVALEQARTFERDGWNARTLHLYSHAGTHMDAQTHFAAGPETIDGIPLARCMGWAWVVKLDGIADKTPVTPAHLGDVAARLQPGESLLLRTGWSRHVSNPQHYRDNLPRIADDLARWCVERKLNILGVEPPSVADVNNKEELTRIHQILLGANITIVEGLTNLNALTQEKVFFIAAPLKIERGDGCPCRAFAVEGWSGGFPAADTNSPHTARLESRPSA